MSKTNARCARQRTHADEPAPWVAEFTHDLLDTGYTPLTVRRYVGVARHLAHWLVLAEVAVADVDETVMVGSHGIAAVALASVVQRTSPASTSCVYATSSSSSASAGS